MAISDHRKFLPLPIQANQTGAPSCYSVCSGKECYVACISSNWPPLFPLPPSPPSPPLTLQPTTVVTDDGSNSKHQIHPALFVMVGLLGAFFLLFASLFLIVKFCPCCDGARRRSRSALSRQEREDTQSDFVDDDQGLVMENPFWYINTVGLDRSVINSIAMFRYKKGDGLVEGTDCSVCLGEFREDETLRLLPKCSHAFHVECIDTWLGSHTNCPLCRARVVSDPVGSTSAAAVPVVDSNDLGDEEESRVESSGIDGDQSRGVEGEDCVQIELGLDDEGLQDRAKEGMPTPLPLLKSEFRVLSDLVDNLRGLESGLKPVRRSVSMDFSPASIFCFSVPNNSLMVEAQGSSAAPSQFEFKRPGVNPFLQRLKGTSPIGRALQKSPLSMKRSMSSGSKVSSSRHSRSRSFLLPL